MCSLSPHLASEVQLPRHIPTNSTAVTMNTPLPVPGTVPLVSRISCKSTGCRSTRIRKGCDRWMCKAHCIEAGGCSQPSHKGSQPPQTSASNSTLLPPPPPALQPLSIPPSLHTTLSSPSLMDPASVTALLSQQIAIDPLLLGQGVPSIPRPPPLAIRNAGPAFSSHMSDIFTTQMVDAQRRWEKNSQRDVVRIVVQVARKYAAVASGL